MSDDEIPTSPDSETLASIRAIVAEFERSEHGQKRALAAFNAILDVLAASPAQEPAGEPKPGDHVRVTHGGHVVEDTVDPDGFYLGKLAVENRGASFEIIARPASPEQEDGNR